MGNGNENHTWDDDDDIITLDAYLSTLEGVPWDDAIAKGVALINRRALRRGVPPVNSIGMRMGNVKHLDGQGGLSGYAERTERIFIEYRNAPNKLKERMKEIIVSEEIKEGIEILAHEFNKLNKIMDEIILHGPDDLKKIVVKKIHKFNEINGHMENLIHDHDDLEKRIEETTHNPDEIEKRTEEIIIESEEMNKRIAKEMPPLLESMASLSEEIASLSKKEK